MKGSVRPALLAMLLAGMTLCSIQCKWPWEYANGDDRPSAPVPPTVIEPRPDTTIWWAIRARVTFNWTSLDGARSYDLDIDSSSEFNSGEDNPCRIVKNVTAPPVTVSFPSLQSMNQRYHYRIRGVSSDWKEGMTEWTGSRRLTLRNQPGD